MSGIKDLNSHMSHFSAISATYKQQMNKLPQKERNPLKIEIWGVSSCF